MMPRNIEYLIEQYIEEGNLPLFILTHAIDLGFNPPENILKQFGSGYGQDNFFYSRAELLNDKRTKETELSLLLISDKNDKVMLQNEIDEKYNFEEIKYKKWYGYYLEEIAKLNNLKKRVKTFKTQNDAQGEFLKLINDYFVKRKSEIDNQYKKRLVKPVKESFEQAHNRLFIVKMEEIKLEIKNLESRLLFDESFFREITQQWLQKIK